MYFSRQLVYVIFAFLVEFREGLPASILFEGNVYHNIISFVMQSGRKSGNRCNTSGGIAISYVKKCDHNAILIIFNKCNRPGVDPTKQFSC